MLKKIPKGKVTTYKILARALNTKAYRAVGNVLHKNPNLIQTPCHRVIKSNGKIGGFVLGKSKKIKLLKSEGIPIKNNKVLDFEKHLYCFRDYFVF